MAIAFDTSAQSSGTGTGTLTYSHTCTGSDRVLFVAAAAVIPNGVSVASMTYGGVSMTRINSEVAVQLNVKISLWGLLNPASGANNIVITYTGTSGSTLQRAVSMSYTGVLQSGLPDASANIGPTGVDPYGQSVVTVADNCWVVVAAYGNGGITAGAGVTSRGIELLNTLGGDSNGPKTPAGSYSMSIDQTAANNAGLVMASFAPSGGASTTIKTWDGVARANLKTLNGVASASIKTINGIT